jgi:hypothetical protein
VSARGLPAAPALVLVLAALLAAPLPAVAADRLDVLAGELRDGPVAVDSELSWLFTRADAARLARALRRSPLDVHVAVLALSDADESGGDGERAAVVLHRRLKRPGLYLTVDEDGYIDARAYSVPREVFVGYGIERPPCCQDAPDVDEISRRVVRIVGDIADNKPADTTDDTSLRRLEPYGYRRPYDSDASTREASLASAIMGGMLGLIAGGFARRNARRHEARQAAKPRRRRRRRGRRGGRR